jgi:2-hydroxychromene-2-carboxylate isomerase
MASNVDLEFYFDPICPFAWVTSRWVVEVAKLRNLTVEWKFIALAIVNEETDYSKFPPAYPALHGLGRRLLRVAAAARAAGGNDAVAEFYTAAGERMHHDGVSVAVFGGEPIPENLVAEIVAAAGLDLSLAAAADDESWDSILREETDLSLSRTGRDVGTPILTFAPGAETEASLFGPVISSIPRGDAAIELWDAVQTLARTPGFAELKRSMRDPLSFD